MPAVTQTITSYSLREAAKKVGVSHVTLWRDIQAGKLVAHPSGSRLVIFSNDLLEYVLAHRGGKGIPEA